MNHTSDLIKFPTTCSRYILVTYLRDDAQAASVLFVQRPREQGEWCSQNPNVARVAGVLA